MKNLINEFKCIIWPSKKQVKKEFLLVVIASIIGIGFIEVINIFITCAISLFL